MKVTIKKNRLRFLNSLPITQFLHNIGVISQSWLKTIVILKEDIFQMDKNFRNLIFEKGNLDVQYTVLWCKINNI